MSIALDSINLPADLLWADEFEWTPTESASEYSVDGALIIDVGTKRAGRPITLEADDDRAWIDRTTLQALHALTTPANRVMTLALRGATYGVVWRPGVDPINATPIFPVVPSPDLFYVVTLRLTEI